MSKLARGIFISLFAFVFAMPAAGTVIAVSESGKGGQKKPTASKPASQSGTAAKPRTSAQFSKKKPAKKVAKTAARKSTSQARKKTSVRQAKSTKPRQTQRTAQAPRRAPAVAAAAVLTVGEQAGLHLTPDPLSLKSNVALVVDQETAEVLFEKNADVALPIASLTKLMTALVVVEARQDLDEILEITADDIDRLKNSGSRLRVGSQMTRGEMLHLALMSSENRAASALARHYPGGAAAFIAAMNARAASLGMRDARFVDSTGLSSQNVASAQDLSRLALAAYRYPLIRDYSTNERYAVDAGGRQLQYMNSNRLVRSPNWDIGLQKTGYISEAGRCLIMQADVDGRPVVMVFLDSRGRDSRLGDAARVRKWLELPQRQTLHATAQRS